MNETLVRYFEGTQHRLSARGNGVMVIFMAIPDITESLKRSEDEQDKEIKRLQNRLKRLELKVFGL